MKKTKSIDCIEIKQQSAAQIYEQIKSLSTEEELAYWQEQAKKLHQKQQILQHRT